MLQRLSDLPEGIVGVKATGQLTRDDYERVLEPLLDGARREGRRLRLLYVVGPKFEGYTPGAAWEDAKIGVRSLRVFAAHAVVSDYEWVRRATGLTAFFLPCPVRAFPCSGYEDAVAWLRTVDSESGVSHRLLRDQSVLVVEPERPLRAQDFDAVGHTVDPWIESHGGLRGVVVHSRAFPPGWETLGTFIRHVQFVLDHRRHVGRVALSIDGKLANLLPRVTAMLRARMRTFAYDQLDAAVSWASGAGPA
jgi:hypothetical protein